MSTPQTAAEHQPEAERDSSTQTASKSGTNALAIASFVLSLSGITFVAQVAGIITGHLALKQIQETGEAGHGLAKAGLIISYAIVGLSLLSAVLVVAIWGIMLVTLFATFGSADPNMFEYMSYSS